MTSDDDLSDDDSSDDDSDDEKPAAAQTPCMKARSILTYICIIAIDIPAIRHEKRFTNIAYGSMIHSASLLII